MYLPMSCNDTSRCPVGGLGRLWWWLAVWVAGRRGSKILNCGAIWGGFLGLKMLESSWVNCFSDEQTLQKSKLFKQHPPKEEIIVLSFLFRGLFFLPHSASAGSLAPGGLSAWRGGPHGHAAGGADLPQRFSGGGAERSAGDGGRPGWKRKSQKQEIPQPKLYTKTNKTTKKTAKR